MTMNSLRQDLLVPSTWTPGTLTYRKQVRMVWWMPDCPMYDGSAKIALDQQNGSWYWYDLKRNRWSNTPRITKLIRQFRHMRRTHNQELVVLSSVQRLCREAQVKMLSLNINMAGGLSGRQALTRLMQAHSRLGRVKDDQKVLASALMYRVVTFEYKVRLPGGGEEVRVAAALADTAEAVQAVRDRVGNVRTIESWLSLYSALAERLFIELESRVKLGIEDLEMLLVGSLGSHDLAPSAVTERQIPGEMELYLERIAPLAHFRPFKRNASRLVEEAELMGTAFLESNLEKAIKLARKGLIALKMLDLRCLLERAKNHLRVWTSVDARLRESIVLKLEKHQRVLAPLSEEGLVFEKPILDDLLHELDALIAALKRGDNAAALMHLDRCLSMI